MKHSLESNHIYESIKTGIIKTGIRLPSDVITAIKNTIELEKGSAAKVLRNIKLNLELAEYKKLPLCQDTGMIICFVEMGDQVEIKDAFINDIINKAIKDAYSEAYFRKSVVSDPLNKRENTGSNLPAVIYHEITKGKNLKISLMMKGFGSENCSQIMMLKPTADREEVISTICKIVTTAGGSPCPPVVLGIGIGGTMDYAAQLSKKALLRELDDTHKDPYYAKLEMDIYNRINKLGIGAGGLGGSITTLGVKIEKFATHIAGLPIAVSINCWADRKNIIDFKWDYQ